MSRQTILLHWLNVTAVMRTAAGINKAEDAVTAHGHINSTDALQRTFRRRWPAISVFVAGSVRICGATECRKRFWMRQQGQPKTNFETLVLVLSSLVGPSRLWGTATWQYVPYQDLPPLTTIPVTLLACFSLRPERILLAQLLRVRRKSGDPFDHQGVDDFLPLG